MRDTQRGRVQCALAVRLLPQWGFGFVVGVGPVGFCGGGVVLWLHVIGEW